MIGISKKVQQDYDYKINIHQYYSNKSSTIMYIFSKLTYLEQEKKYMENTTKCYLKVF